MYKQRMFTLIALAIVIVLIAVNIFVSIPQVWLICAGLLIVGLVIDKSKQPKA